MAESIFTKHRTDGWPLCPRCESDELMSWYIALNGDKSLERYVEAGMKCLLCHWSLPPTLAYVERQLSDCGPEIGGILRQVHEALQVPYKPFTSQGAAP